MHHISVRPKMHRPVIHGELLWKFIDGDARGSAGEVRSMMAVVNGWPKLKPMVPRLAEIRALAESCARQLTAWTVSNDTSPVQGSGILQAK